MRKIIALATAAAMCLSLTACSVSVSTSETTKAAESAAETTAAEAAESSEAADSDLVATADYPTKPINMIIPYGAGGTTDVWGRKLAALLEKYLSQSITVTNQGGASGSIGCQSVKEQPSDGYTLLVCAETLGTYRTMNICDLDYEDFTVISPLVGDPKVLVVGKDSKYNTLEELLDDIKANPGKVTMSHSGPGGSGHNQGLVLKELGYDVAMTSFDSGNDALLGVIGGQVDFTNPNISTLGGYIESGNDTPQEVVDVLKAAAKKVFADQEWTDFVKQNAADPVFEKYTDEASIKEFYDNWKSVICWLQYDNGVAEKSPEEFGIARIEE